MFNAGSEQLEYIFTSVIVEYAPEQYSNHSGAYILEPPGTMPLSGLKVSWASWKSISLLSICQHTGSLTVVPWKLVT